MSEDMNKDQIEFDKSKLHKEYPAGSFVVTEEEVSMYCNSIGEKSDICHDKQKAIAAGYRDIVAPPTFCALFVRGFDRPDINLKFGNSGFHAGEAIDVLEPICVGDKLEASIQLRDVYVKTGRMQFNAKRIQPVKSIGELEKTRQELIGRWRADGTMDRPRLEAPLIPRKLHIITGGGSAALADMERLISDRWQGLSYTVIPVLVQGN